MGEPKKPTDKAIVELEISLAHFHEALLFAVAHGWRPSGSAVSDSFEDDEAPTEPYTMATVLP